MTCRATLEQGRIAYLDRTLCSCPWSPADIPRHLVLWRARRSVSHPANERTGERDLTIVLTVQWPWFRYRLHPHGLGLLRLCVQASHCHLLVRCMSPERGPRLISPAETDTKSQEQGAARPAAPSAPHSSNSNELPTQAPSTSAYAPVNSRPEK